MCLSCPSYVKIGCTHIKGCKHCHASVVAIVQRSIPSVALVAFGSK